jgi:hypothetical protein
LIESQALSELSISLSPVSPAGGFAAKSIADEQPNLVDTGSVCDGEGDNSLCGDFVEEGDVAAATQPVKQKANSTTVAVAQILACNVGFPLIS